MSQHTECFYPESFDDIFDDYNGHPEGTACNDTPGWSNTAIEGEKIMYRVISGGDPTGKLGNFTNETNGSYGQTSNIFAGVDPQRKPH